MAEFKVGDRVRCINDRMARSELAAGRDYVVERLCGCDVVLEGCKSWWVASRFELVSAIRTVTKREIVPGSYDGIQVREVVRNEFVSIQMDRLAISASELRAAAVLFNELADVLDEQKEAA